MLNELKMLKEIVIILSVVILLIFCISYLKNRENYLKEANNFEKIIYLQKIENVKGGHWRQ